MTKLAAATAVIAILGLFGAMHARGDLARPSAAAMLSAPATASAIAPASTSDDEDSCDGATASEDAASCIADGSQSLNTCCANFQERWVRPDGSHKCCGPCFF